ncbi:MAG: hypothetical protein M3N42_11115, partial [Cyanobacteriota bacterium]|nr:hypothetical protein [Cyanobacteriota bacterium]
MDNFEEKLDFISNQLAALSAQIAEEKKALGHLWKKVDELENSFSNDIEHLSNQTSEWTQTNLQLMKLLATKTEETERLAQNSSRLTDNLSELKKQLAQSQQPTTKLNNSSENLPVLADTKAAIPVQQLSSSLPIFAELNMRLKALLKLFLPKSMILDTRKICEIRRNGEELDLENLPKTIDWGMAQYHFIQEIANAIYPKIYPPIKELKNQLKELKENQRDLTSIANASP